MIEGNDTYLGDGVYASFDGYQIWLAVNHHENKQVALEPAVFARLCQYVEMLKEKNNG
jgi:type II secretory pathway component PulM